MKRSLIDIGIAGGCVIIGSYIIASQINKNMNNINANQLQNTLVVSASIYNEDSESIDLKNNIDKYVLVYDEDGIGNKNFHLVRKYIGNEIKRIDKDTVEFGYDLGTGKEICKRYDLHVNGIGGSSELYMDLVTGNIISVINYADYLPGKITGNKILKKTSAYPIAVQYIGDKERYTKEDLKSLMDIINNNEKVEENKDNNKVLIK